MLREIFTNLLGPAIVASGRAIKIYNLDVYAKHRFDITPEQYLVLDMLKKRENLSQNKLCKLLFKDKSNMARLISILNEKGLIEKTVSSENNKSANIIISQKGKDLHSKISPIAHDAEKRYLNNVSQDDMYICIKVLTQIQKNLEKKEGNAEIFKK